MSMIVAHNNPAVNTHRNLGKSNTGLAKSIEKLSSGYKINVGADGPASLVISEQLRSQQAGLERALSNVTEANNFISIAEGALNEMNSLLKSMRSLAIHSDQSGITSPDQVLANQREIDSAISTLSRIANTTKYSDTLLLNGSQAINYDLATQSGGIASNQLVNTALSDIYMIGANSSQMQVSFNGVSGANETLSNTTSAAKKAYLEGDKVTSGTSINTTNTEAGFGNSTVEKVAFSVGNGSTMKKYAFEAGASLGSIASSINANAETTGVAATLVFGSEVVGAATALNAKASAGDHATARTAGMAAAWAMDKNFEALSNAKSAAYTVDVAAFTNAVAGKNTDADGCVYAKMTGADTAELYKDAEMTQLVGTLAASGVITAANSSGFQAAETIKIAGGTAGDVVRIQVAGGNLETTSTYALAAVSGFHTSDNTVVADNSVLSGVRLGENTDQDGKVYVKVEHVGNATGAAAAGNLKISVYSDANMKEDSLVSVGFNDIAASATTLTFNTYAVNGSGLYSQLTLGASAAKASYTAGESVVATLTAQNVGIRLSSTEYGKDAKIEVQMDEGTLFQDANAKPIGKSYGAATAVGQNATLTVNGQKQDVGADFKITIANVDTNALIALNMGKLGMTTVAYQGYDEGALASKAGAFDESKSNYATLAINKTTDTMKNFADGVQLHIGEGTNSYERAILGIRSMDIQNLGRIRIDDKNFYSIEDIQSGGKADLATDPLLAMEIIAKAIDDVSETRAQLGAVQANLLTATGNNLQVAIENIQKTESAIRDTDMASEMTEFTKNQVLQSASISMLAQANQSSQSVLQLLG